MKQKLSHSNFLQELNLLFLSIVVSAFVVFDFALQKPEPLSVFEKTSEKIRKPASKVKKIPHIRARN